MGEFWCFMWSSKCLEAMCFIVYKNWYD